MKRLISFLLGAFCAIVFAWGQGHPKDVTMISYEQRWADLRGTLALKNNTDKNIVEVSFRMTYMDMKNNPMDYEEFRKSVEIASGMTRKIDIPAYEYRRNYHYYKTPDDFGHPAFKIKYELLGYRVVDNRTAKTYDISVVPEVGGKDSLRKGETVVPEEKTVQEESKPLIDFKEISSFDHMILLWYAIAFIIGMFILVAIAAHDRSRSMAFWIIFSMCFTPVVALFLLVIFGDSNSQYKRRNQTEDDEQFYQ